MSDLKPITPLGSSEPRLETIGTVTIAEVTDRALASVTCRLGQDAAFQKAAKKFFGFVPPDPGLRMAGKDYALIWTGPGQWLAEAPFATHEDIAAKIIIGLGTTSSVTEQTDAWAMFDLTGAAVTGVLERLTAVDVRRMADGAATRTAIEHMGAFVICQTAGTAFTVMGPRSFAASLHHALAAAARSVA